VSTESRARHVFIAESVRTPFGRRGGALRFVHPVDLLGAALTACIERSAIDPEQVGQIVGGCVEQVGEQTANPVRNAWIEAGYPDSVAAVSIDSACGSSQQAVGMAAALVAAGVIDVAVACGLASMTRLPIASSFDINVEPVPTRRLSQRDLMTEFGEYSRFGPGQFGCAERLAEIYRIERGDCDQFGFQSQRSAKDAWDDGRFDDEVVTLEVPWTDGEDHEPTGSRKVDRDEGLRDTSLAQLAALSPIAHPQGVHTAGTASQISDGATALLIAAESALVRLGLNPIARIVDHCHVGVDPVLMLEGPIPATRLLLERNGLDIDDIDVFEVNEAFASVPLAWLRALGAEEARLNPNGGAIALGHPVGATGGRLVGTAARELQRRGGRRALVAMCAGGGLGTGTLLERV
jgi:acetyl-CoA C-acetyltransferase